MEKRAEPKVLYQNQVDDTKRVMTNEERLAHRKAYLAKYRAEHREENIKYQKDYYRLYESKGLRKKDVNAI